MPAPSRTLWTLCCTLSLYCGCGPVNRTSTRSPVGQAEAQGQLRAPPGADWPDDPLAAVPLSMWSGEGVNADENELWGPMSPQLGDEQLPGRPPPGQPRRASDADKRGDSAETEAAGSRLEASEQSPRTETSAPGGPRAEVPAPPAVPGTQEREAEPGPDSGAPLPARIAWAWKAFYDDAIDPALAAFLALAHDAPHRADVRYGVGRCLLARGELEAAGAQFAAAADLDARDPESRFYLGVVAYQREDFAGAIAIWEAMAPLLDARPPGPLHRNHAWLLARAYLEAGAVQPGERWFARAMSLGGQDDRGRFSPPGLSLEWLSNGRLPGARYMPVGGRQPVSLGSGVIFATHGAIWRMTGSSSLRERLTQPPSGWRDGLPAPEPNGSRLAFISTDSQGEAWLYLQESAGDRRRIYERPVAPIRPAWSRDRSLVAFVAMAGSPPIPRIHLLRLESGDIDLMPWPAGPTTDPAFTPVNQLLFSTEMHRRFVVGRAGLGALEGELFDSRPPQRAERQDGRKLTPEELERARALRSRGRSGKRIGRSMGRPMFVPDPWAPDPHHDRAADRSGNATEVTPREKHVGPVSAGPGGGSSSASGAEAAAADATGAATVTGGGGAMGAGATAAALAAGLDLTPRPIGTVTKSGEASGAGAEAGTDSDDSETGDAGTRGTAAASSMDPEDRYGDDRQPSAHPWPAEGLVAFTRQLGYLRRVWVRDVARGAETAVSPPDRDCSSPGFSPDGARLLFVCQDDGISRLYVYDRLEQRATPAYLEELSINAPVWWETAPAAGATEGKPAGQGAADGETASQRAEPRAASAAGSLE